MDSLVSWLVLLAIAILITARFIRKYNEEMEANHRANDNFFWERENGFRRK